ncbi:TlpA family protein disulfide reductase [Mucilaginibacter gynuensis]
MIKKLLFLVAAVAMVACIQAKNHDNTTADGSAAATKQQTPQTGNIDHVPPFKIVNTDSVTITQNNLKKDKPVMIIYFAPDCGHCQHLVKSLKPVMKQLSNVQVVMITWTQLSTVKKFYKDYGLAAYPNFTLGTEGYSLNVQRYYQVKETPYIAIYDHKGQLVKAYEKVPEIDELMTSVKKA